MPYEAVRTATDPDALLLEFLQSSYEAAADCAAMGPRGARTGSGVQLRPRVRALDNLVASEPLNKERADGN